MKKIKISLIINILIVLLVLTSCIFTFFSIKFMSEKNLLEASGVTMFKYFTIDSNILMGLASLIFVIYEIKMLKNKIKDIPLCIYLFKFIATSGVTLTFIVTALFLTPQYGFYALYNNSNLFLHLIIPLLSIITYIFFEKYDNKYKYTFLGIIPMVLYSVYYAIMILTHLDSGGLTYKYDFYGFLQGDVTNIYTVVPVMYIVMIGLSFILVYFNKLVNSSDN